MHTTKSRKYNKISYHVFIQKKNSKNILTCILDFNNQFIKAMRTRSIFQKYQKNYFVFF